LRNGCLSVRYAGKGIKDAATTFTTRIYLAMPSCDGPAGCLSVDAAVVGGFAAELSGTAREFRLDDAVLGGSVEIQLPEQIAWQAWPHRTVSQSEAGFEKIMQAWVLELTWPVVGEEFSASLQIQVGRR